MRAIAENDGYALKPKAPAGLAQSAKRVAAKICNSREVSAANNSQASA